MQKYYRLKIQHNTAEKFFIQNLIPEIKKFANSYLDFFFTRKEKQQVSIIDVYLDKKLPNSQIIMLENALQRVGVVESLDHEYVFSDTEGNFGLMGDEFLSTFFKETNETAIKIL
ncbi:hypothetical protein OSK38_25880, partial [Escherichia coli]|nr:hypothetical protein [Escherichia coli]